MNRSDLIELANTTLSSSPPSVSFIGRIGMADLKIMADMFGHPILDLIKQGRPVPIDMKIFHRVPSSWILDWKRKYA